MAAYKTITSLTEDVITSIGLVDGTAVQSYTTPQIQKALRDGFYFLERKRVWEHLNSWDTYTLDGTMGIITTDVSGIIKTPEQIIGVWRNGENAQLVKPTNREHLNSTGTKAKYVTPILHGATNYDTRIFQVWPKTAVGSLDVHIRTHVDLSDDDAVIPFPYDLMQWLAAWMVQEADGMNPANAAKCYQFFDKVYVDYIKNMDNAPIGLGTAHGASVSIWT